MFSQRLFRWGHAPFSLGITLCLSAFLGGCGGGNGNGSYSVSGIVLSYPASLTRDVTLADLTPVGAGVTVGAFEQGECTGARPEYYKKHSFPTTGPDGRFTVKLDDKLIADYNCGGTTYQGEIYLPDGCSTDAVTERYQGVLTAGPGVNVEVVSHQASDQLQKAAMLAQGHFNSDVVIVQVDRTDACRYVTIPPH